MAATSVVTDFELPAALEASTPPEARGLRRDEVRLLVSNLGSGAVDHGQFLDLPRWLEAGDVLVVNTSGTLNAALLASDAEGRAFELHLSTRLPGGFWAVEIRQPAADASMPYRGSLAGSRFTLPAGGEATLLAPYPLIDAVAATSRLWMAALRLPGPLGGYLETHGFPIRYKYVPQRWPSAMYQTVFATEAGSAEMPSAGRPFTTALVTALVSQGVDIAPLLLHTGVASLEDHEPPYEEQYRVPRATADRINAARAAGRRVIAVGTTVVRALETVTDHRGVASPGEGWTDVVISRARPVRSVDGMITGLHEPRATHLMMLEQVAAAAGRFAEARGAGASAVRPADHLDAAYGEAMRRGYLWHEFGDAHLILP
ncbi:MAG TPA: S-adenosylmethionine:tRNA ribosyltransferase-isomerase [Vicinamibacterales bacterium]|nr:S-adenosylmethionine:tRNA ribosyltransferase-isomerase [Vicinamibacterales bacterium]